MPPQDGRCHIASLMRSVLGCLVGGAGDLERDRQLASRADCSTRALFRAHAHALMHVNVSAPPVIAKPTPSLVFTPHARPSPTGEVP